MALNKKRLLSFFLSFLMAFNVMMPAASVAEGLGGDVPEIQTRGASYTVSINLQEVNGNAAQVDLSSKNNYHLYLCLKLPE